MHRTGSKNGFGNGYGFSRATRTSPNCGLEHEEEDEVQMLHREMADLRQKREAARKVLDDIIEGMTLEAKL